MPPLSSRQRATRLFAGIALCIAVAVPGAPQSDSPSPPGAETVARKAEFPAEAAVGGETLPLRGRHTLRWWGFDVYTAAFYVAPDRSTHDQILAADSPRKLVLHYHRRISAADIAKATERMIARNPHADVAGLRERLDAVYECYSDVREGDEYHIAYDPATKRTEIVLNGESQCTVEGDDFARAFFGIWVGPHGISSDMRRNLTRQ